MGENNISHWKHEGINPDINGSAWTTLRRAVFQGGLGQQPWDGAKIAARSQEIPSEALLVLPISQDVAGGPRGLVFSPGWYGGGP